MIGRADELASLTAFLGSVPGGASAFVLDGEAGVGKTTLWQAGLRIASETGCRVLSCRPTGSEAHFSFAALGDLLQGVLGETLPQLPGPQRHALELALGLAEAEGPPADEQAVARGVLGVLRLLAGSGSVVVAVDDMPWLDRSTATVLEFVARRLGEEPIGLLLARRTKGNELLPLGLERALPPERLYRLQLGPLGLGELHELLEGRLQLDLPRPTVRRLHDASGGNPFFALEIGRALVRLGSGLSPGAELPVPETLRELVRDRLAGLPSRTREALLVAAALSQPTLALIDGALGGGARASMALGKAVEADVVELDFERVRFTHPLLASTLYSETSLARRRRLHRRLADVLADPEKAAWHLALAAEGPDSAIAAAVDTAAAAARARGAPEAAALLSEHARRLTPSGQRADLWRRTMEAYEYNYQAGDPQRGRQLLEEAVALAPGSGERAEALDSLGRIYLWDDVPRSLGCFREALAEVDIDARTRAASEHGVAMALFFAGEDLGAAAIHARSAVASGAEIDSIVHARAVICQAQIESERGEPQAAELMKRALGLEGPTRHWHVLRQAGFAQTHLLVRADRLQDALVALERLYQQAVEQGDESSIPIVLLDISKAHQLLGNWAEAKRLVDEAYERSLETGHLRVQAAGLLGARARVDALLGLVASAHEGAEQAVALAEQAGAHRIKIAALGTLGLLELSLGHPATAHDFLAEAVAGAHAAGIGEPTICGYVVDDVEALVALGRLEEAELLLARYEERARALQRVSALAACGRCRGLLLAARADLVGALGALGEALEQHQRALQPFERARTLLVQGVTQRRAKKKAAARESLEQALAVFDQLGARLWAEKARAELKRIGGRAASRWELTPTEARVAELVAVGHTNREVAAELFMSVRTVDWNLRKIYGKLGVHSRRELAARAHRPIDS